MESFERGTHVIVTCEDEKVAGHLIEVADDGYVIAVTHTWQMIPKDLPDETVKVIRSVVDGMPLRRLRWIALINHVKGWRKMSVWQLRDLVAGMIESETVAALPTLFSLQEINMPVKTWFNGGEVRKIQVTNDVNADTAVGNTVFRFKAGLDAEIEELLSAADAAEKKETNDESDVHPEQGSEDTQGSV
jgi:hypothetical protein